jgi:hypothetical protein
VRAALAAPAGEKRRFASLVQDCVASLGEPREILPSLIEHADRRTRAAFVEVLDGCNIAPYLPADRIAAALLPALGSKDASARFACARMLAGVRGVPAVGEALAALRADPATPATLLAWLADPDPKLRDAATRTMYGLRRPEFLVPLLDAYMTSSDPSYDPSWTLAAYSPEVVDELVRRPVTSKEDMERLGKVLHACLDKRGDTTAAERCLDLIASRDVAVRDACLRLLGVNFAAARLPENRLLPIVLRLARDEDPRCRSRCFHVLKILSYRYAPPPARAALTALETDADPGVREHAKIWGRGTWTVCPCEP